MQRSEAGPTEAAELGPTKAPELSPADEGLPSYADAVVQPPLPVDQAEPVAREVPRDGRGMQVLGGVALASAVGLGVGTGLLAANGVEADVWAGTLILGLGAGVAGSLFLYGGRRRQLRYREWEATHGEIAPRQGNGLVAGGSALLVAGAGMGMFGTIGWAMSNVGFQDGDSGVSPVLPALLGAGIGSLAAGTALTVIGMKRHKRFQAWRSEPRVALLPVLAPMPGGGQVGVVGRF